MSFRKNLAESGRGFYNKKVQFDGVGAKGYSLWECLINEVHESRDAQYTTLGKECERDTQDLYEELVNSKDYEAEYKEYLEEHGYLENIVDDKKPKCVTCKHPLLSRDEWASSRLENENEWIWENIVEGERFTDKYNDEEVALAYKLPMKPSSYEGDYDSEIEIPDWFWKAKDDTYARIVLEHNQSSITAIVQVNVVSTADFALDCK
jgi:hypothetical protein